MTYDPEMAEYDESFDNAEIPDDAFREVPSGTYQVYVDRATFDQPDWAEFPKLSLTCKIINGAYEGSAVFPSGDVNPEYIHHLKGLLAKMGLDPVPKPSEIRGRLSDMLNRILEVYVTPPKESKNGKRYSKCYVNRFVKMLGEKPVYNGDEPPPHDDSEIPF